MENLIWTVGELTEFKIYKTLIIYRKCFPNSRWIDGGSDGYTNIKWPGRSSNLFPWDFFLYIQSEVNTQPRDMNELNNRITVIYRNNFGNTA